MHRWKTTSTRSSRKLRTDSFSTAAVENVCVFPPLFHRHPVSDHSFFTARKPLRYSGYRRFQHPAAVCFPQTFPHPVDKSTPHFPAFRFRVLRKIHSFSTFIQKVFPFVRNLPTPAAAHSRRIFRGVETGRVSDSKIPQKKQLFRFRTGCFFPEFQSFPAFQQIHSPLLRRLLLIPLFVSYLSPCSLARTRPAGRVRVWRMSGWGVCRISVSEKRVKNG